MIHIEQINKSRFVEFNTKNHDFGSYFSDHMLIAEYENGQWKDAFIKPYGPINIDPSLHVIHYGQSIFEGLKAFKSPANELCLFRPKENYLRFNKSAQRMCMPTVPENYFIDGIKKLVSIDQNWVPNNPKSALYIRPFMFSSSNFIKASPSDNYTFAIISSPVSAYYTNDIHVKIEENYTRANSGGTGAVKASGNYGASFYPASKAKKQGFDQLIWTDGRDHNYIEESGTMNIFFRQKDSLICPKLTDSILPGITRDSIIKLCHYIGIECEQQKISIKDIIQGMVSGEITEAFGAGTAATIASIKSISWRGTKHVLPDMENSLAARLKKELQDIQYRRVDDPFQWTVIV